MTIAEIKQEILDTYPLWKNTDSSFDGDKIAELHEHYIRETLAQYCEDQGYLVEGFPAKQRKLAETNEDYDYDYFCWERFEKYIDFLCLEKDDVLELRFFYYNTFWPDQLTSKKQVIKQIHFWIKNNGYDIEF